MFLQARRENDLLGKEIEISLSSGRTAYLELCGIYIPGMPR